MLMMAEKMTLGKIISIYTLKLALLCLMLASCPIFVHAQSEQERSNIDAVLILDASGSMRLTDPVRLRDQGARILIDSLNVNDRLSLVEFAEQAKEIRPLTGLDNREELKADLAKVGDSGEYTDLLAGLTLARQILSRDGRADAQKLVFLISDGKMDPQPDVASIDAQTGKLFSDELPAFKGQNITIHTVAFSDLVDQKLLSDIAVLSGGMSIYSPNADGLKTAFSSLAKAVSEIKPSQDTLQYNPPPTLVAGKESRVFTVDFGVEEATFYVNRGASSGISITTPTGETFDLLSAPANYRWFRGDDFDVVTVTQPAPGDWSVGGIQSKENFATVLTNLKLVVALPPNGITAEQPFSIEVSFLESRKPINLPQLSSTLLYSYQIIPTDRISEPVKKGTLQDDGSSGDTSSSDGVFSTEVSIEEPGNYRLVLNAVGKTFSREHQVNFKVEPRLLTLSLVEDEVPASAISLDEKRAREIAAAKNKKKDSTIGKIGANSFFKVAFDDSVSSIREPTLKIKALSSTNKTINIPIAIPAKIRNEIVIPTDIITSVGTYEVYAVLSGAQRGRAITAQSNPIEYVSTTGTGKASVSVEVITEEDLGLSKDEPESSIQFILSIFILTGLNVAVCFLALRFLRKALANIELSDEPIPAPDNVLEAIAKINEGASRSTLNLSDPALSPKNIEEILSRATGDEGVSEEDSNSQILENTNAAIDSTSSKREEQSQTPESQDPPEQFATKGEVNAPDQGEDGSSKSAEESSAQSAPPVTEETQIDPSEKVESEVDEDTKKLLEELGQELSTDKGS